MEEERRERKSVDGGGVLRRGEVGGGRMEEK